MTVKQAVKENKMISVILGVLASALLAWGIWVTDAAYEVKYGKKLVESRAEVASLKQDAELKVVCDEIFELKKSDVIFREELKQQRDMIHNNQQEVLRILLNIQKRIRE
jgi:hypothetical protein